jgi:hypothetical protein
MALSAQIDGMPDDPLEARLGIERGHFTGVVVDGHTARDPQMSGMATFWHTIPNRGIRGSANGRTWL